MIRGYSPSDLDALLRIEKESFPKSPYDRFTFAGLHALYPRTFLVDVQDLPRGEEGAVRGYIVFSAGGHILSIAVDPAWRRKGIGRRLIEAAAQISRTAKIWAEVRRSNAGAQAFYFVLGFDVIGTVANYYGNEDALIVEWNPFAEERKTG